MFKTLALMFMLAINLWVCSYERSLKLDDASMMLINLPLILAATIWGLANPIKD